MLSRLSTQHKIAIPHKKNKLGRYIQGKDRDPTGDFPLNAFQRALVTERDNYQKLVPNASLEARSWDLVTILNPSEIFHSLTAFKRAKEWGPDVLAQCTCPGCHKKAACQHSALMTMLANPTCSIPKAFIAAKIEDRKKRGGRPLPDVDDEEDDVGAISDSDLFF